jgi:hypothetical protein
MTSAACTGDANSTASKNAQIDLVRLLMSLYLQIIPHSKERTSPRREVLIVHHMMTLPELVLIFVVLFLVLSISISYISGRTRRLQAAEKLDQLTAATRSYIETLEQRRTFAPVALPGLHLEPTEFAMRHDDATLAEFRRARVGGGIGTRVRVGGFPIYLGGWKSVPKEELRIVGAGQLVLTNRRLLFLGAHTLAIPFDRLLTCQQTDAGLVVSESRRKTPHVFVLENNGLWCFLVNWMADNRFEDQKLPDGMHISVTGEAPHLQVHVTGRGILGTL